LPVDVVATANVPACGVNGDEPLSNAVAITGDGV
jgi:hypothetical protein